MKKKAIYKITNNINNKAYIGQSINPEKRWEDHIKGHSNSGVSLIHRAIIKYGIKNFNFEIIGWFEDYNEKEKYYIQYYRTLEPYGYNLMAGGEEPPHGIGEKSPSSKISNETARRVQEQILDWNIPRKKIVKDNKITFDIFRHINEGDSWRRDDLTYPLRPSERKINELKADKVINLLQTTNLSQKEIASMVGWARSAITMINIGQNHHRDNINYPIRK